MSAGTPPERAQIGVDLEQPFGMLPLDLLADRVKLSAVEQLKVSGPTRAMVDGICASIAPRRRRLDGPGEAARPGAEAGPEAGLPLM